MTVTEIAAADTKVKVTRSASRQSTQHGSTGLLVARLAVPIAALVVWQLLSGVTSLVPSVPETAMSLVDGFTEGWIYPALASTGSALGAGLLAGAAVAIPLGYFLGRSKALSSLFEPMIAGTFAVPRVILYPIFLAIFGVGFLAEAWMVGISAFFPILMSTAASTRNVSPSLLKLGRSLNASKLQVAFKIVLPDAAPGIMVGLRIGFSIAFVAAIIAELFAAKNGIGLMIADAQALMNLPRMYALVTLVLVTAFAGNMLLWWVERRLRHA